MISVQEKSKLAHGLQMEVRAEQWFLEHHPGARRIAKNYRCRVGELDLVFEVAAPGARSLLVVVEVRARDPKKSFETGIESLRLKKQFHLTRAIRHFLVRYAGPAKDLRVDLIAIEGDQTLHYPGLWDLAGAH